MKTARLLAIVVALVVCAAATPTRAAPRAADAPPGASVGECPLFPANNAWRKDISAEPVAPLSSAYIASLTADAQNLHPDFGSSSKFGIPFTVVPADQKPVKVKITQFKNESDPGPYPIPRNAQIESGSDRHTLVAQNGSCKLFELYQARHKKKKWSASGEATFDLNSNALRPAGFTSADAAGLPILPGLVRREEIATGIKHALRFTTVRTQKGYVDPARHFASSITDPNVPPLGLRIRLKSSFDISTFTGASRVILQALKTYGMFLADNGSAGFISGARDTGWDDNDLAQLKTVPISAFEAVQHGEVHTS